MDVKNNQDSSAEFLPGTAGMNKSLSRIHGVFCGANRIGFVSILNQTKICSWNFSTKLEFKSFHSQLSSSTAWYGLVCLCLLLARVILAPISLLTADLSGGSSPASSGSLMTHTQAFIPLCYESTTPMRYLPCSLHPFQALWSGFCSRHKVKVLSLGHGKASWGKEKTQAWGLCGWDTTTLPWGSTTVLCVYSLRHPDGLCLGFACSTDSARARLGLAQIWGKRSHLRAPSRRTFFLEVLADLDDAWKD